MVIRHASSRKGIFECQSGVSRLCAKTFANSHIDGITDGFVDYPYDRSDARYHPALSMGTE